MAHEQGEAAHNPVKAFQDLVSEYCYEDDHRTTDSFRTGLYALWAPGQLVPVDSVEFGIWEEEADENEHPNKGHEIVLRHQGQDILAVCYYEHGGFAIKLGAIENEYVGDDDPRIQQMQATLVEHHTRGLMVPTSPGQPKA